MRCTRQVIFISDITVERFRIFSYINFIYPQMHPVGQEEGEKKKEKWKFDALCIRYILFIFWCNRTYFMQYYTYAENTVLPILLILTRCRWIARQRKFFDRFANFNSFFFFFRCTWYVHRFYSFYYRHIFLTFDMRHTW